MASSGVSSTLSALKKKSHRDDHLKRTSLFPIKLSTFYLSLETSLPALRCSAWLAFSLEIYRPSSILSGVERSIPQTKLVQYPELLNSRNFPKKGYIPHQKTFLKHLCVDLISQISHLPPVPPKPSSLQIRSASSKILFTISHGHQKAYSIMPSDIVNVICKVYTFY